MSQIVKDDRGYFKCRDCGDWFDPEKKRTITKAGYIDQCVDCSVASDDDKFRYVGLTGRSPKGGDIFVVRTNTEAMRMSLKRANACGFTANLTVGNVIRESSGN
jgi:hypothetical protein